MISSSRIFVAGVCCWDKLIVSNSLLLIILSWHPFSWFILAFSLNKLSLLVMLEYAQLSKKQATLFLQLVWCWELCSLAIGQYAYAYYIPVQRSSYCYVFSKVSRNASHPLLSSSIVNLMNWLTFLMWWKKFSKCARLRME